jgi:hypothetical protein
MKFREEVARTMAARKFTNETCAVANGIFTAFPAGRTSKSFKISCVNSDEPVANDLVKTRLANENSNLARHVRTESRRSRANE